MIKRLNHKIVRLTYRNKISRPKLSASSQLAQNPVYYFKFYPALFYFLGRPTKEEEKLEQKPLQEHIELYSISIDVSLDNLVAQNKTDTIIVTF